MKKQSYLFLKEDPEVGEPAIPSGAPRPENLDYSQYKGQKFTERKEAIIGFFNRQFEALRAGKIKNEDQYYENLKNINLSFALDTGFNFFKFNVREPNKTLYSVEELKNTEKTSPAVLDKITANKIISDNYGYLSIIDNFYSLLEQGKIKIINLGGPTGGLPQLVVPNPSFNKTKPADKKNIENLYIFNLDAQSFSSFAGEGRYKDITVEKLVELAYIFYNDKKAMAALNKSSPPPAPAKPEKEKGGGTGGGKVPPQPQSDGMRCGRRLKIKNDHPLGKPPASDIGESLQIQLKRFWNRIGTDTLSDKNALQKLYDCKIGPTTRQFAINTLDSVGKDIDDAIKNLEAAIKQAESGAQPTKESRRLEDLYKLLSERLRVNKAKSNWLFEAESTPTTPAATTTPPPSGDAVRTTTAASTPPRTIQVDIGGNFLSIEDARKKVEELKTLRQEAIAAKEALEKETKRVVKTTIDKVTTVLKKHETTQSAVYSLKQKPAPTPAPAGGGGKPEPAPAPQVPAVPRTQEASCWFTFNENVRGTPNTTPTDLWNQARARTGDQTMLSWEAWEEIAKKVITDKAANPSYNFTTGTLTPFKAQVELLIQRKDVNINLGCFRTIFGNVRDVLLSLLESSKQYYEQLEPERKENFLKSVSQFLIKSGNSVVYENTNVHKMYVTLEKVIEYSNFLTRQIIKTATTGIADGKLDVSLVALLPRNEQARLAKAARDAGAEGADTASDLANKPAPAPAAAPAAGAGAPAGTPPAGTPPAGAPAKPAETPAPAPAADAETPPAGAPAKPAETPPAPAAGAGAPAAVGTTAKPDPKAEEAAKKAKEVTKVAAAKQENIQRKADQLEAIRKKAEEQRNAQAVAKAEAAQKVLDDQAKKAREEANVALKAAQAFIIKTHKITGEELKDPQLSSLLNDLAKDGDQYPQILQALDRLRPIVKLTRDPRTDAQKKADEEAQRQRDAARAREEERKQLEKKRTDKEQDIEAAQKITDPKTITIEQAQKLYFSNYDKMAAEQARDETLKKLIQDTGIPLPGSLIEKENMSLVSNAIKQYIKINGPLNQNLLYYTIDRSFRPETNKKTGPEYPVDNSTPLYLLFKKESGEFVLDYEPPIYLQRGLLQNAYDFEKHINNYITDNNKASRTVNVDLINQKIAGLKAQSQAAGAGGKPQQQKESLKQKREWLLHEALFKKLVKRNG